MCLIQVASSAWPQPLLTGCVFCFVMAGSFFSAAQKSFVGPERQQKERKCGVVVSAEIPASWIHSTKTTEGGSIISCVICIKPFQLTARLACPCARVCVCPKIKRKYRFHSFNISFLFFFSSFSSSRLLATSFNIDTYDRWKSYPATAVVAVVSGWNGISSVTRGGNKKKGEKIYKTKKKSNNNKPVEHTAVPITHTHNRSIHSGRNETMRPIDSILCKSAVNILLITSAE